MRDTDKAEMAKSFCNSLKEPDSPSSRPCEMKECLSNYYWKAEYAYCMAPCGQGKFEY